MSGEQGANGPEGGNQQEQGGNGSQEQSKPVTFASQEEFDKVIANRLSQQERQFQSKYGNFDELVNKAKAFDQAESEKLTELQKIQKENEALAAFKAQTEAAQARNALVNETLKDEKLTKGFALDPQDITGNSEDEIKASIQRQVSLIEKHLPKGRTAYQPDQGKSEAGDTGSEDWLRQFMTN